MLTHLVGNVSWNSNRWLKPAPPGERARSGFRNIREGWEGNESWNFDPARHLSGGVKYGSFEGAHRVKSFSNGRGIVFFWSRAPRANVFVGCYVMPTILAEPKALPEARDNEFNLTVPTEPKGLICPFRVHIECVAGEHLRHGDAVKKHPGQCGYCYIDDRSAGAILAAAWAAHPCDAVRAIRDLYQF